METLDIIVLGKELAPYGITSDYKNRLDKAIEVYRAIHPRVLYHNIIITGGIVGNRGISEAQAGFEYLKAMYFRDVPSLESAIILEKEATGTIGNAAFTKLIVLEHGTREPTVVTSDYHIKRAEFDFNYVYGPLITPTFIASSSDLVIDELRRIQAKEERSLMRDREFFRRKGIGIGDHDKTLEVFREFRKLIKQPLS